MSAFILVLIWTMFLLIFAEVYVLIDSREVDIDCGLGKKGSPIDYTGAFAFALETTTTVSFLLCYQFGTILRPNIIHIHHKNFRLATDYPTGEMVSSRIVQSYRLPFIFKCY